MRVEKEVLEGVLRFGNVPIAVATMGYNHQVFPRDKALAAFNAPNFLLKIIPHVDCSVRICDAGPL